MKNLLQATIPHSGEDVSVVDPRAWWSLILGGMVFVGALEFGRRFWQTVSGHLEKVRAPMLTSDGNGEEEKPEGPGTVVHF